MGVTEMRVAVGRHPRLDGQEFEQAPGDSDGRGSLVCCSPWGRKESDMPDRPNNKSLTEGRYLLCAAVLAGWSSQELANSCP